MTDDGRVRARRTLNAGASDTADTALAHAIVAAEPWVHLEVWKHFGSMANGVLRRALGPDHDFDDLTQEVFLRVFDRGSGLRDLSTLRSFIYSATIRVVSREIRRARARRHRQTASLLSREGPEAVTADPETRDLLARVQTILDGMLQKERADFVLGQVEGQGLSDIAQGLNDSLSTAKRFLEPGVRKIEKEVERDDRLSSTLMKGRSAR